MFLLLFIVLLIVHTCTNLQYIIYNYSVIIEVTDKKQTVYLDKTTYFYYPYGNIVFIEAQYLPIDRIIYHEMKYARSQRNVGGENKDKHIGTQRGAHYSIFARYGYSVFSHIHGLLNIF